MFNKTENTPNVWMSFADLITGALIVFMLITVVLVIETRASYVKVEEAQKDVTNSFTTNLIGIKGVNVTEGGSVRFTAFSEGKNTQLFKQGSDNLSQVFKHTLNNVLPMIINKVDSIYYTSGKTGISVKEFRVEGHTNSDGPQKINYVLSQGRALNTWYYIKNWIRYNSKFKNTNLLKSLNKNVVTVGFGETRPLNKNGAILKEGEKEDKKLSRRVELSIILQTTSK
jgi:outer membrane protein OmpA-like peptidoglycan-associated protein